MKKVIGFIVALTLTGCSASPIQFYDKEAVLKKPESAGLFVSHLSLSAKEWRLYVKDDPEITALANTNQGLTSTPYIFKPDTTLKIAAPAGDYIIQYRVRQYINGEKIDHFVEMPVTLEAGKCHIGYEFIRPLEVRKAPDSTLCTSYFDNNGDKKTFCKPQDHGFYLARSSEYKALTTTTDLVLTKPLAEADDESAICIFEMP